MPLPAKFVASSEPLLDVSGKAQSFGRHVVPGSQPSKTAENGTRDSVSERRVCHKSAVWLIESSSRVASE
jgi:hypothetical protein